MDKVLNYKLQYLLNTDFVKQGDRAEIQLSSEFLDFDIMLKNFLCVLAEEESLSWFQKKGPFILNNEHLRCIYTVIEKEYAKDFLSKQAKRQMMQWLKTYRTLLVQDYKSFIRGKEDIGIKNSEMFRRLWHHLQNDEAIRLCYAVNSKRSERANHVHIAGCLPIELEFDCLRNEWYLFWWHTGRKKIMVTPWRNIYEVSRAADLEGVLADKKDIKEKVREILRCRAYILLRINTREPLLLKRIYYAFSRFYREIEVGEDEVLLRVFHRSSINDAERVLKVVRTVVRFVEVLEPESARNRMCDTASKAKARYL